MGKKGRGEGKGGRGGEKRKGGFLHLRYLLFLPHFLCTEQHGGLEGGHRLGRKGRGREGRGSRKRRGGVAYISFSTTVFSSYPVEHDSARSPSSVNDAVQMEVKGNGGKEGGRGEKGKGVASSFPSSPSSAVVLSGDGVGQV